MFLLEPSYTVFTHVHWEGARGSTLVGLHVIVLQAALNGDTVVWKLCVVVTVFKHIVKAKSSDFTENYQTVFKFYHHHHHHRDSCIQVLDCLNSIR